MTLATPSMADRSFFATPYGTTACCASCHSSFRPTVGDVSGGPAAALYCSRACRRGATSPGGDCAACGSPRVGTARAYATLDLCYPCRDVAWATCWRKVVYWREPGQLTSREGNTLTPYRCTLCRGWHHTKYDPTAIDPGYLAHVGQLARLIRSRNFLIDAYRHREHEEYPQ